MNELFAEIKVTKNLDVSSLEPGEKHEVHSWLHRAWHIKQRTGSFVEDNISWSQEDIFNLHQLLIEEMDRENLQHHKVDELDAVHLSEFIQPLPHEEDENIELILEDVLSKIQAAKLYHPFVYITGGIVNHGRTRGDVDILIKAEEENAIAKATTFRIMRMFPEELQERLHFMYESPEANLHGPICLAPERIIPILKGEKLLFERIEELFDEKNAQPTSVGEFSAVNFKTIGWKDDLPSWVNVKGILRKRYSGQLVELRGKLGSTIVTPNHSVYNDKGELKMPSEIENLKCLRKLPSVPQHEFPSIKGLNVEKYKYEFLRIIADYVTEGFLDLSKSRNYKVCLARNINEGNLIEKFVEACKLISEKDLKPYWDVRDEFHAIVVKVSLKPLFVWLEKNCKRGAKNKQLPSFIFGLSLVERQFMLNHLMQGDGYNQKEYSTASPILAAQMCFLMDSLGLDYRFAINDYPTNKKENHVQFQISIREKPNSLSGKLKKTAKDFDGYVYDLECEDVHNFVDAHGMVLVHNTSHVAALTLECRPIEPLMRIEQSKPKLKLFLVGGEPHLFDYVNGVMLNAFNLNTTQIKKAKQWKSVGVEIMLDNGAFSDRTLTPDELLEVTNAIEPNVVCAPDFLYDIDSDKKSIDAQRMFLEKKPKCEVMMIPQGQCLLKYENCIKEVVKLNPDYIGIGRKSIQVAGAPGRGLSRFVFELQRLEELELFDLIKDNGIKIHALGLDNPHAFRYLNYFGFTSNDSMSYIWSAMYGQLHLPEDHCERPIKQKEGKVIPSNHDSSDLLAAKQKMLDDFKKLRTLEEKQVFIISRIWNPLREKTATRKDIERITSGLSFDQRNDEPVLAKLSDW